MKGKKCKRCGKGTYEEFSVLSDMHGEYKCTNCGHMAYSKRDKKK